MDRSRSRSPFLHSGKLRAHSTQFISDLRFTCLYQIVPSATPYLFSAISTWSNLRHLKLTNLALPSGQNPILSQSILPRSHSNSSTSRSSLCTIHLGQTAFLDPSEIARIVCSTHLPSLQEVKVVDAYRGSIWGPRIRIADIEAAATALVLEIHKEQDLRSDDENPILPHDRLVRIREIVRCEAKTERLMGGDRVEVVGLLLI